MLVDDVYYADKADEPKSAGNACALRIVGIRLDGRVVVEADADALKGLGQVAASDGQLTQGHKGEFGLRNSVHMALAHAARLRGMGLGRRNGGLFRMRRFGRAALGGLVAFGLVAAVPAVVFAAQPTCGSTLTSNTTLTADLDCSGYSGDALQLGANKITLNLNGHTIWGPAGADLFDGVDTEGHKGTTITNGTIKNYTYGVDIEASNHTTVSKLTIKGELDGDDYGVYLDGGVGNIFNKLTVSGVRVGMYLTDGANSQVTNSSLTGTDEGFYGTDETGDWISGNTFTADVAVYDYESARQTYANNTAHGTSYGFELPCNGYGKVTLTGNTANGASSYGFYLYECYGPEYSGNPGAGSHVTGNIANNGGDLGYYDYYSSNEVWKNNTANDNVGDGYSFDYPTNAQVTFNTALRNGANGFDISDNYSYYNFVDFSSNTAKHNTSYGFYADYGAPGSGNIGKKNGTNCYNVDCN